MQLQMTALPCWPRLARCKPSWIQIQIRFLYWHLRCLMALLLLHLLLHMLLLLLLLLLLRWRRREQRQGQG